jgi:hypothetical protein
MILFLVSEFEHYNEENLIWIKVNAEIWLLDYINWTLDHEDHKMKILHRDYIVWTKFW